MIHTSNQSNTDASGIDVSRWQGTIDWAQVAASGVRHGAAKMTEGGTLKDVAFVTNIQGMRAHGIKAAAYHYFRTLSSTPQAQLANIRSSFAQVGFDTATEMFAIDVEETGNEKATPRQTADRLYELVISVKDELLGGQWPHLYIDNIFWRNRVEWRRYDFSECPLWIANWKVAAPRIPDTWLNQGKSWSWWQHSDKGEVPGIIGAVDLNRVR